MRVWLAVGALLLSCNAHAQRKLSFQSKFDKFDLSVSGGRGEVNGKSADMSSLKDLLPLLNKSLPDSCPSFKKAPDLTVREGAKTHTIYGEDGIVSDGKNCITISGEGLFYFPVHRDFLIGSKSDGINLKSPLKVFQQGKKLFELRKQGDTWISEGTDVMLDWDFISRLENSLKQYDVRLRVQAGIGKDKPKMIIQSGGETIEFYKVTSVMWAMKKPGTGWLVASDEWSFWRDFDQSLYEDRFADDIRNIQAATDKEGKMSVLRKVEAGWSRNLRDMYHKLASNQNEDPDIRTLSIRRLKSKPSLETAGVMVKILEDSTDDDIRDEVAVILKLNNPKGPKWKASDPPEERQKALDFWRSWWRQKQSGR